MAKAQVNVEQTMEGLVAEGIETQFRCIYGGPDTDLGALVVFGSQPFILRSIAIDGEKVTHDGIVETAVSFPTLRLRDGSVIEVMASAAPKCNGKVVITVRSSREDEVTNVE